MAAEQARRAFQDDNVKTELFRLLEAEPFPEGLLLQHYPALLQEWRAIADAMQVPWQYVMVCELSLASFCSPTAVLFPWNTLRVYPVLWWFLLRPGAFNTSGIIRLYSEACFQIFTCSHSWSQRIVVCDQVWHLLEQDINAARGQLRDQWQGQGNQRNPFAGSVSATSGSGSLEGEGKLMALPQNLSRSCGFLTEGPGRCFFLCTCSTKCLEQVLMVLSRKTAAAVAEKRGSH